MVGGPLNGMWWDQLDAATNVWDYVYGADGDWHYRGAEATKVSPTDAETVAKAYAWLEPRHPSFFYMPPRRDEAGAVLGGGYFRLWAEFGELSLHGEVGETVDQIVVRCWRERSREALENEYADLGKSS